MDVRGSFTTGCAKRASAPILSDHVYVVPPNKQLGIVDGTLRVAEFTRREHRLAPVDAFFRVLADTHGSRSACVVLSGTGPNGSAGLKRIKEYGGLVIGRIRARRSTATCRATRSRRGSST